MKINQLDHLGIVAGIIKDLGIIELINSRIKSDKRETITTGQAVAAMIINGLGFSDRPLSLTPQFFENKPLALFFSKDVEPKDFNRFKLGRSLDDVSTYGCDLLFSEIALAVCKKESIDMRYKSEDTTSFSLTGEYYQDSDEHLIKITHGYSKDHRSDLKQIVLELLVSHDGGVPLIQKTFSGNASDNKIFQERASALVNELKGGSSPDYLIGDSKMYSQSNAENLKSLLFITRIPSTINEENEIIKRACEQSEKWIVLDEENSYQSFNMMHYGISQTWVVIFSKAALARTRKRIEKAASSEFDSMTKKLSSFKRKSFCCKEDAQNALFALEKTLKFHSMQEINFIKKMRFDTKGRPKENSVPARIEWRIGATLKKNDAMNAAMLNQGSCYVIGTNIPENKLSPKEVISAYKGQNSSVERGFRFLKDPLFFASSLFIKKTSRIIALVMIMTLALLVYSIAQRRIRRYLCVHGQTLPNQINQPTQRPTLRWLFQILHGISIVYLATDNRVSIMIDGVTDLKRKILCCFGSCVQTLYLFDPVGGG